MTIILIVTSLLRSMATRYMIFHRQDFKEREELELPLGSDNTRSNPGRQVLLKHILKILEEHFISIARIIIMPVQSLARPILAPAMCQVKLTLQQLSTYPRG